MPVDRPESERPSPEALLEAAKAESRGKLKIFLGAAPGVGKTYAMLRTAAKSTQEGIDIVIGVVETHGRTDTATMLGGMEELPRAQISYRGITLSEFDIDAALERRPQLILIDELAHTNAPGSRHPKRYQDVEEILEAGIDVYTTLNIQHLESLNDVIAKITGITVRETVPDTLLRGANSIELIDLAPDELLKRLSEGKVYIPDQAQRAMQGFFTPGNLTALRELALRHAAEQVDRQMLSYMQSHAIEGPWPTRERILVAISSSAQSQTLVRNTKRIAERRGVPWVAVYVENYRAVSQSQAAKNRIANTLRLAQQLGGEAVTITGENIADEIIALAKNRNVTLIIVGRSHKDYGVFGALRSSVTKSLLQKNDNFDILISTIAEESPADAHTPSAPPTEAEAQRQEEARRLRRGDWWVPYFESLFAVAVSTLIVAAGSLLFDIASLSQVYLLVVLAIAVRHGLLPSLFASAVSFVIAYYVLPLGAGQGLPYHENFLQLLFFILIAFSASKLGARIGDQVAFMRKSAQRTEALFDFSKKIAAAVRLDDVLWTIVHHVTEMLKCRAIILLPKGSFLEIAAAWPPEDRLDTGSAAAAEWSWRHGRPAGRGSGTLPSALWLFLPLYTARGVIGVIGVREEDSAAGSSLTSPEQMRHLTSLTDQAAIAIERTSLVADIEQARLMTETERLRVTLLASISQDLRTPLIGILSMLMSLRTYWPNLDDTARHELIESVRELAERLNRSVQNLLDMTRLGTGVLEPNAQDIDFSEILAEALARMSKTLGGRKISTSLPPDLPKLHIDRVQIEQVLLNLLDNICKYTDEEARIGITAALTAERDKIRITLTDDGPGIPPSEREKVFDVFYRAKAQADQTAGVGLGLAVCRGIIEKHGGRIFATNPPVTAEEGLAQGTAIVIELPVATGASGLAASAGKPLELAKA